MDTQLIVVAIISAIIGGAIEYVFLIYVWPERFRIYTWIYKLRNHRELGEPCKTDLVLDRIGYSLGYSFKRKSALWVTYIVTEDSVGVDVERGDRFYADTDIPEKYRVEPNVYKNTGYDKGHLAPSAAIDFSRESNDETFAMSNISFQHPKLNRQAWGSLEDKVRDWTETKGKLIVATGPIFGARNKRIEGLPVPRRFYKVIYSYDHQKFIGFIFPNEAIRASELWNYAMPVEDVENETGYDFFDNLSEDIQKNKETLDLEFWKDK